MRVAVRSPQRLRGRIEVPGDKSISHRALILNSIAAGEARLTGLNRAADIQSTISCLRALGVEAETGRIVGVGLRGLQPPAGSLDCGNSGTTMRLLGGLLAAQPFASELTGDESLRRRPMDRVVQPLRLMGAYASWPPLRVGGQPELEGIEHRLPVPSAQVKSALLLAGLYAKGVTRVVEPGLTRNHTELMLHAMGAEIEINEAVEIRATSDLRPLDVRVPGDLSAAANWLVAGTLHPDAEVWLPSVGVNPTRSHVLGLLRATGLDVNLTRDVADGVEPAADLTATSSRAGAIAISVTPEEVPLVIDELPVLAVAATQLSGVSRFNGAAELRVKESDRIAAMHEGLKQMGADVRELEDGLEIAGPVRLRGASVRSRGDHRVAMALAVAGMLADNTTEIDEAECVAISYPDFWDQLETVGALG